MARKKEDKIKGLDEYEEELEEELEEDFEDDIYEEETDEEIVKEEKTNKKHKKRTKNKTNKNTSNKKISQVINIVLIIVLVLVTFISIDFVMIRKFNKGPFFAIKYKSIKDGGTKQYIGLGYKVIDYNVTEGRKGKVIGSWKLKYNKLPVYVDILDIAIEFENDKQKTANKFYNEYIGIKGKINSINKDKNSVVVQYKDDENKYSLDIEAELTNEVNMDKFNNNDEVYITGVPRNFIIKTEKTNNKIIMKNCYMKK